MIVIDVVYEFLKNVLNLNLYNLIEYDMDFLFNIL